jgi:hypothetical protein
VSYWCLTVNCKNPGCHFGKSTFLPYPNPPKIFADQPNLPPPDWQLFLVCRHCGQGYAYTAQDARWIGGDTHALWEQNSFLSIGIKCADPGCESPVLVHICVEREIPEKTLLEKLTRGSSTAKCEKDHPPAQPLIVQMSTEKKQPW